MSSRFSTASTFITCIAEYLVTTFLGAVIGLAEYFSLGAFSLVNYLDIMLMGCW